MDILGAVLLRSEAAKVNVNVSLSPTLAWTLRLSSQRPYSSDARSQHAQIVTSAPRNSLSINSEFEYEHAFSRCRLTVELSGAAAIP
jgi:hypothetical protein